MAILLSGTDTIFIIWIGCWSSEDFFEYIREQVEQFTLGVSNKISQFEHLNTTASGDTLEIRTSDLGDLFV